MQLDSIPDAIAAIQRGELVVVVDDTDRENEGDLIMAASKASPERLAFMIRHTSGILCVPVGADRADRLNLQPMVANNVDPLRTAFTVSVDYRVGLTTGISAEERAATARALANDNCTGTDFIRPGHMFPLISRGGGVLTRSGHTEAATDLARLAALPEAGVLAEIVNDDGTVKRLPELVPFAREHGLRIVSIEDLIQYRVRTETLVEAVGEWRLPVRGREARIIAFSTPFDPVQHVCVVFGEVGDGRRMPCRIHREQPIVDAIARPGAPDWVDAALAGFGVGGRGVLMLLRTAAAGDGMDPERRNAADEDHASARRRRESWREIGVGAQILRELGISSIVLVARGQQRYIGLAGFGIEIEETRLLDG